MPRRQFVAKANPLARRESCLVKNQQNASPVSLSPDDRGQKQEGRERILHDQHCAWSPRYGLVFIEVSAGRAIGRESSEANSDLGTLSGRSRATMTVEIGGTIAGIGRVYLDRSLLQLLGEGDGYAVYCGLFRQLHHD
jgi:hypothetical protein